MSKLTLPKLILYALIPLQLLIFSILVPPFQKPDEQPHFEKALLISKGYLFCNKKINNTALNEKKYVDFIKTPYLDLLTYGNKTKLPMQLFIKDLTTTNESNKLINFNIDHLCSFPLISYLPQAISLWFLSLIRINPPIQSIYFVRFAVGFLCYFWFLYLYKKINDKYKLILLFTFALPMTLHQVSSFSYDAMHIMFALTFFMLIINWKKGLINQAPTQYAKLFFVLFLFLASKKIGYEAFFIFVFLLPFETYPMIISSIILGLFYGLSKLTGAYDLQYSLTVSQINPLQQLGFLISNPLNIFIVLIKTTVERFPFYLHSLIGIFGWLEYGLDPLSYFIYGMFFIYVIANSKLTNNQILGKNKNILLLIILIISYIFIVLLAFVFNTTPGHSIAHGVQGRYFIPFVPFIFLLITQFTQKIKWPKIRMGEGIINIIYVLIILYLILATFLSVFHRYY